MESCELIKQKCNMSALQLVAITIDTRNVAPSFIGKFHINFSEFKDHESCFRDILWTRFLALGVSLAQRLVSGCTRCALGLSSRVASSRPRSLPSINEKSRGIGGGAYPEILGYPWLSAIFYSIAIASEGLIRLITRITFGCHNVKYSQNLKIFGVPPPEIFH